MDAQPAAPSDVQLRQQYDALLAGDSITADYERWRELKRLVIVHGLPRDEGVGVESNVDMTKYAALVGRGASHYDGDIRNDTFRTFRGDLEFAQRVPEEKLLLHRLPEDLLYEIARHPFENPDAPTSLPFHPKTISAIATQVRKQQEPQPGDAAPFLLILFTS
ncbi:hypothetical protein JG688_00005450 [Phytophthora aleatoria]|uniref:Uncharacterized protein n=1 Tax=Phytophthora aleatoria TaxID=2496075 RepID=A0A8J5MAL4_9STRA|nr:hypothetical protein JG688_00005450 [Phytophthora aleatoria]